MLNSLTGIGFVEASLATTSLNGRFIEISKRDIWTADQVKALRPDLDYHIVALDTLTNDEPDKAQRLLQKVMKLFEEKVITVIHETEFPLSQAIHAFQYLQQAKQIGKVVVTLPPPEIKFQANASYLVTGGLGGIGLEVAKYLSENGAGRIILAARRTLDEKTKEIISKMSAQVLTHQADISDTAQVEELITFCDNQKFPLKGIFHAAGIINDAPLDKQTAETFENVFAAKAKGAWILHELTNQKNLTLDYFVLFSSIASLNGSPAQSNYATANSFLDGLALYRQQHHQAGLSINWGPWAQVGMAKDLVKAHQNQGFIPISSQDGISALDYVLRQEPSQLGIMHINAKHLSERMSTIPSWLEMLLEQKQESALLKQLQEAPIESREQILNAAVSHEVRKLLGLSTAQKLDETKGFFEMGMDSLMALELKNRLQSLLHRSLSNTMVFDYPCIKDVCNYLNELGSFYEKNTLKLDSVESVLEKLMKFEQKNNE